jgi:N-acylneuraminate cytidylyltransferase
MSRCFAVIPARGGSKGIPRKNLQLLGGVPLIAIAVRTALNAEQVSEVIVTTDDPDIAAVARAEGASVVERPTDLSGDVSSSEAALLHVLEQRPDLCDGLMVFMQCTSPFTQSSDLEQAIERYQNLDADVMFSAVRTHAFLWEENESGAAVEVNHDRSFRTMRQGLKPQFQETGAFYLIPTKGFLEHQRRFFGKVVLIEIPKGRALDIDDEDDLRLANLLVSRNPST